MCRASAEFAGNAGLHAGRLGRKFRFGQTVAGFAQNFGTLAVVNCLRIDIGKI
jgi:hypothetical protein